MAFLVFFGPALGAQTINQAEFIDKPLVEILAVLGAIGGKSIVVDDTVSGNATHYLTGKTFDQALRIVLETNHLYQSEKNGVLIVSRILVEPLSGGRFNLSGEGVDLETLLRRLARESQTTILYDNFPRSSIDINLRGTTVPESLKTVLAKLPGFVLETSDHSYYLRNTQAQGGSSTAAGSNQKLVTEQAGLYSVNAKNVKVSDLLESLFASAKKEYSLIKRGDAMIDKIAFQDKEFDVLLRLILQQAEADFTVQNGIYFIVDANRTDIVKKFETSLKLVLTYLSVNSLVNIMPGNIANGNAFKIDKASNSLILNGSFEEIQPIIDFVRLVDKPTEGLQYYRFDLMNLAADAVIASLPENLKVADPILVKGQNSFILLLSPERLAQAQNFVALLDKPKAPFVIKLKYIKAEDLVAKLPAFISKEQLSMSLDQRYVFFTGSKDQHGDLLNYLRFIDLPVPQIKYQVLVVQYQESISTSLGLDFSRSTDNLKQDTATLPYVGDQKNFALVGAIGNALKLNFDVVADFGYMFASSLNASLSNNKASVLLDTTLNALSNQDVTFKNTNTYRYADKETAPDTGTATTSKTITREIVSGIVITMKGWVSGDGMITMNINSTISKRGTSDASATIPETYEKVITTSVRTPSGKPIVVGGLMQHDTGSGTNLLYFKDDNQNTELMIYIIPRVETPLFYDAALGDSLMYLYNQYAPNGQPQDLP